MFDKYLLKLTTSPLIYIANICAAVKIKPLHITLFAVPFALMAFFGILLQAYFFAGVCVIINRILDGLDGALARQTKTSSSSGAYLDIVVDYLLYAAIPLAHGLSDLERNMIPALLVLAAYVFSGVNFLAVSSAASSLQIKSMAYPQKKIFYAVNVIEGTETILYLTIVTFFPLTFRVFSFITFLLIILTLPFTTYIRYNMLRNAEVAKETSLLPQPVKSVVQTEKVEEEYLGI